MRSRHAAGSVLSVLLLAAAVSCGNAESPADPATSAESATSSSPTTAAAAFPECSKVWVAGQKLPEDYGGCEPAGELSAEDQVDCSSGQTLVIFDERQYAVLGGKIFSTDYVAKDTRFKKILLTCKG